MESRFSGSKSVSPAHSRGRAPLTPLAASLAAALAVGLALPGAAAAHPSSALPVLSLTQGQGLEVFEASIPDLQEAMSDGRVTAVQLVDAYLARIAAYDHGGPALNSMIRLNPNARAEAEALDQERALVGVRGPLHGIPVIMKDNYDVAGLPTSGGSIALAGMIPPNDAFQVAKLREAGAVILGKSNMHELAYGITTISSVGGQTRNPYDPSRNPGGSSGGTGAAIAASFAAIGWGSDTCGSIRIPASHHNLFGLRPTKGLSSIDGIIPLSHTQDVASSLQTTIDALRWIESAAYQRHAQAQNTAAWILATSKFDAVRDGARALVYAELSVAQLENASTLDTLAAAYAETGDYDRARVTQTSAIGRIDELPPSQHGALFQHRIHYESDRPWRE